MRAPCDATACSAATHTLKSNVAGLLCAGASCVEGGYDQQICCDALPLATGAPEIPAEAHGDGDGGGTGERRNGGLFGGMFGGDTGDAEGSSEGYLVAVVVGVLCLGMVAVVAALGRSHMQRMEHMNRLMQRMDALCQKVDAKGAITEESRSVNLPMQGADTLVNRVHGVLDERLDALSTKMLNELSAKIDGSRLGCLMSDNSSFENGAKGDGFAIDTSTFR